MDNKIELLTKQLYEEGVSKGKQESEEIVAKAKAEAQKIISDAEVKAAEIVAKAQSDAAELSKNSNTELAMASRQIVGELKSRIANLVTLKSIDKDSVEAFKSTDFIASLIVEVVKRWDKQSVKVYVESEIADSIREYLTKSVADQFSGEVEIVGEAGVGAGFKIAPSDEGYYISFTDQQFNEMLKGYIRDSLYQTIFN